MNAEQAESQPRSRRLLLLLAFAGFLFLSAILGALQASDTSWRISLGSVFGSLLAMSLLGIWTALRGRSGGFPYARAAFLGCIAYGIGLGLVFSIFGIWVGLPSLATGICGLDELKSRREANGPAPLLRRGNYYAAIGGVILFGMSTLMFLAIVVAHFTEPVKPGRQGPLSLGVIVWGAIVAALFVVCLRWYGSEKKKA